MIKSLTFIKNCELSLEKDSQKRWGVKTYHPNEYSRDKKPYKMFTLFKKKLHIEFNDDINIIVGENGSGKSTLFSLIKNYAGKQPDKITLSLGGFKNDDEYIAKHRKKYYGEIVIDGDINFKNTIFFSAEKDNPVVAIPNMLNPDSKKFPFMVSNLFDAQEESHGESMLPIVIYILENAKKCSIFLDEPETALSLKNQILITKKIQESARINHNQIFVSTHALAVIQQFNNIFDMESRKWVEREKYINGILK